MQDGVDNDSGSSRSASQNFIAQYKEAYFSGDAFHYYSRCGENHQPAYAEQFEKRRHNSHRHRSPRTPYPEAGAAYQKSANARHHHTPHRDVESMQDAPQHHFHPTPYRAEDG